MSALIIYIQQETGDSFQCNKTRREIKSTQFEKKGKTVLIPGWFHLCGKLNWLRICIYLRLCEKLNWLCICIYICILIYVCIYTHKHTVNEDLHNENENIRWKYLSNFENESKSVCRSVVFDSFCNPVDCIGFQAPLSMEFSRQEYWSE